MLLSFTSELQFMLFMTYFDLFFFCCLFLLFVLYYTNCLSLPKHVYIKTVFHNAQLIYNQVYN